MLVRQIDFENFRNLNGASVRFESGVNVLKGRNAQGKSNILEGIYLFARGKSFRGARTKELISFGAQSAGLKMLYAGCGDMSDTSLEIFMSSDNTRKYLRRGAILSGVREMIGSFRAVLFCPAHLSLACGTPAVRRAYLDIAISQLIPSYIDELSRYQRLIAHRNVMLKDAAEGKKTDSAQWESFGQMIALSGLRICVARLRYTHLASSLASDIFADMTSGAEIPDLSYSCSYLRMCDAVLDEADKPVDAGVSDAFAEKLIPLYTDHIEREIKMGCSTLYGIHKDDIDIKLNDKPARIYASQGQQRSLALAMKLSEGELSRKISGEYPVFLLDDVLSELDSSRREYVLSLAGERQIIITSCDADLFRGTAGARIIGVENGNIAD